MPPGRKKKAGKKTDGFVYESPSGKAPRAQAQAGASSSASSSNSFRTPVPKGPSQAELQQMREKQEMIQRAEMARRKEEEERRQQQRLMEEERERAHQEVLRREREEVLKFRQQEEEKRNKLRQQQDNSDVMKAARERMVAARKAKIEEENRRVEAVQRAVEMKKLEEARARTIAQERMMSDLGAMEATLRREEARLKEMQEINLLKMEMEARSAQQQSRPAQQQHRPQQQRSQQRGTARSVRGAGAPSEERVTQGSRDSGAGVVQMDIDSEPVRQVRVAQGGLEARVESVYLQRRPVRNAEKLPEVPFLKLRDGLYRFGSRNVRVREDDEVEGGVVAIQGVKQEALIDFLEKYERVEAVKLKGFNASIGALEFNRTYLYMNM
mgnify:CR=1 FL=1|tara:strand:- start:305 stop:1453 length:1149 start_codon:yes stop_codon:yes gene_type:complete